MFEKDLLKDMSSELGKLTDEERDQRVASIQQLLDNEMKRRASAAQKSPQSKSGFFAFLKRLF